VLEGVETVWPPLIDPAKFWRVQRILDDPTRRYVKPHRAKWLLSNLIRCAVCGGRMRIATVKRKSGARYPIYQCTRRSCTGITARHLDAYVTSTLLVWLANPAVLAEVLRVDDSAAAMQARADADRARAELAELYREVEEGKATPTIATRAEQRSLAQLADAERRAQAAAATRRSSRWWRAGRARGSEICRYGSMIPSCARSPKKDGPASGTGRPGEPPRAAVLDGLGASQGRPG
jgi:Recombinase zinc beta ribbon domain